LLAIAQYISKTLDNNQTIEEARKQIGASENKTTQNVTRGNRLGYDFIGEHLEFFQILGCAKINAHYFVKEKSFVRNKSFITNGIIEGTMQANEIS